MIRFLECFNFVNRFEGVLQERGAEVAPQARKLKQSASVLSSAHMGATNSLKGGAVAFSTQSVGSGMNVLHHRSALTSPEVGATPKLTVPHRFSQRFSCASDCRRKMRDTKTCFVSRPPLSRLRRRFAPLRGALRRYAALRAALSTALRAGALRAQLFYKHEKKAAI